jgi:hypothetical protein
MYTDKSLIRFFSNQCRKIGSQLFTLTVHVDARKFETESFTSGDMSFLIEVVVGVAVSRDLSADVPL